MRLLRSLVGFKSTHQAVETGLRVTSNPSIGSPRPGFLVFNGRMPTMTAGASSFRLKPVLSRINRDSKRHPVRYDSHRYPLESVFRPAHDSGSHGSYADAHALGRRIQEGPCLT